MKVYKIRHKPTGLFWRQATSTRRNQLHFDGKIYTTKAKLHWIAWDSESKWTYCDVNGERKRFPLSEFEVMEFDLTPG